MALSLTILLRVSPAAAEVEVARARSRGRTTIQHSSTTACGGVVAGNEGIWVEVTPSEHAHERAALNFLRARLPAREPYRAWSNFTFQADDGRRYEVDLLVVTPTEVFLVEIKSHPNRLDGDAGTWVWTTPEGRRRSFDNPDRKSVV